MHHFVLATKRGTSMIHCPKRRQVPQRLGHRPSASSMRETFSHSAFNAPRRTYHTPDPGDYSRRVKSNQSQSGTITPYLAQSIFSFSRTRA